MQDLMIWVCCKFDNFSVVSLVILVCTDLENKVGG